MVFDHVINFGSWADANFSTDPDTSLSVDRNVTNIGLESKQKKRITGCLLGVTNGLIIW